MTIQWTLIASFLYSEMAVVVLLLLPFVPARMWKGLFQTRICQFFARKGNVYFTIFIGVLVMFFIESVREMRKYSAEMASGSHKHMDSELQLSLKLSRAQRNYYISGVALFLWFVLRKLILLILTQASLHEEIETTMRKAQSATDETEKLLKEQIDKCNKENAEKTETHVYELRALREKLALVEEELEEAKRTVKDETEK